MITGGRYGHLIKLRMRQNAMSAGKTAAGNPVDSDPVEIHVGIALRKLANSGDVVLDVTRLIQSAISIVEKGARPMRRPATVEGDDDEAQLGKALSFEIIKSGAAEGGSGASVL